jgi:hypothetical protein
VVWRKARDIYLIHQRRQNHAPDILPQVLLELQVAFPIEKQVARESREILCESLVERILGDGFEPSGAEISIYATSGWGKYTYVDAASTTASKWPLYFSW